MTDRARVLVVLGTRPEAIKLAPVVHALRERSAELDVKLCVTGQHREMLDPVLRLFGIVPDHDLQLMRPDQTLAGLTSAVIGGVATILASWHADWVVVQGDTTTALGAGLAGFYAGARVAHVEAGLRTVDKHSPFPEEANRRMVDVLSDLHFAPTERARENLLREAADPRTVHVTGNTVIDALRYVAGRDYDFTTGPLSTIPFDRRIVLVTAHRRESFGPGLIAICGAVRQLADEFPDIQIVYPVHLNPNVRRTAHQQLAGHPRISLTPPLEYAALVQLMRLSTLRRPRTHSATDTRASESPTSFSPRGRSGSLLNRARCRSFRRSRRTCAKRSSSRRPRQAASAPRRSGWLRCTEATQSMPTCPARS